MSFGGGGGSVSDSNVDSFATDQGGIISIDRDTGEVSIDGSRGGMEVMGGVVTNLNTYSALKEAEDRAAMAKAAQLAARLDPTRQGVTLANNPFAFSQEMEAASQVAPPQSPVVATGLQPVFSFLGRLGPQVFRDPTGRIDPIQTAAANTPVVGSLMQFMDWFDQPGKWSTESPFDPNDAEQSSFDGMNPYSFPGDLPGGGFDRTAGEGGDPFQNIITPIEAELALEEMEEAPPTLPAPETPTYDPALFYRPTLLDQPSGLPNFAALNDAFTRSYALRTGIDTDQPNLLGYTPYA